MLCEEMSYLLEATSKEVIVFGAVWKYTKYK